MYKESESSISKLLKISQFANDKLLICKSCHSVEKAVKVLLFFGNFGNGRMNFSLKLLNGSTKKMAPPTRLI